jgi:predicted dehydrogenase
MPARLRVAIAGMGFIGPVHLRAARTAGAEIAGLASSQSASAKLAARALRVDRVYESAEALCSDPSVDLVHICTPNHMHARLARLALEAGKHVVCEKPLATTAVAAADLALLAAQRGVVAAVPFVYRYHPVVREARARVARGQSGAVRLVHGSYLQDWLALPEDYNWRVDTAQGGESRAFADIGSHWCDLVEFVTGHRITRVSARAHRFLDERMSGTANAFQRAAGERRRVPVAGEDAVTMMFETDRGAAGTLVVSQVSQGRKNRLWFEIDAARESIAFDQEEPERLWVGSRGAQQILLRDPAQLSPDAARYAALPAGHAQGYADAFNAFVADAYSAVRGDSPDGLPTFNDGLRAARITEAVLASARSLAWEEIGP